MKDQNKTKKQLIEELTGLRQRILEVARIENERNQAEEALRDSEESLRVFLNANPESSLLIDTKGTILIANESLSKRLGKRLDEIIGSCLYDLLPEDIAKQRKSHFDDVFLTGKRDRFEDIRMDRNYETFVNPVFDTEGNVTKVAILGFDITEHKRMEEELRKNEEFLNSILDTPPCSFMLLPLTTAIAWSIRRGLGSGEKAEMRLLVCQ